LRPGHVRRLRFPKLSLDRVRKIDLNTENDLE